MDNEINFFGLTTFRNQRKKFGIKTDDRRRHFYIIGKTGMGKTVMLKNMVIQDIQQGRGIGFIDPHGEAAEELLDFIPSSRINDVVYINPADLDFPIAFNIMENVDVGHRHLVASGLMGVFKKIWPDVWSARMEYILNNSILALLEYPDSTLLGVNRMLADPEYRKKIVDKVTDPVVKSFWVQEFARYNQRYEVEATAAIQNKVGQFISNPLIRNIIGQVKSSLDMRKIMDEKKILIINISKGRIGEDNSRLLGALLITKLQLAAMSRVDIPEEKREDFFLYVDEFQNFATESFTNILSEARKYRLSLILGHQYITQMEETVRDAVFGNVGTIVVFRVGAEDAEFLEKEFTPEFMAGDLVNLPKYNIDLKLMIDGVAGSAFSAETLPPWPKSDESNREKIIKVSRERYSIPRNIVEEKITKWAGMLKPPAVPLPESRPVLYDAKCSLCGQWTKVIFEPNAARPIYCKNCLKKIRGESGGKESKLSSSPFAATRVGKESKLSSSPFAATREGKESKLSSSPFAAAREGKETSSLLPPRSAREGKESKLSSSPFAAAREGKEASSLLPPRSAREGKERENFSEKKEKFPGISLQEAVEKEPVSFSGQKFIEKTKEEKETKRKEVNLEELREALEESLEKIKPEEKKESKRTSSSSQSTPSAEGLIDDEEFKKV